MFNNFELLKKPFTKVHSLCSHPPPSHPIFGNFCRHLRASSHQKLAATLHGTFRQFWLPLNWLAKPVSMRQLKELLLGICRWQQWDYPFALHGKNWYWEECLCVNVPPSLFWIEQQQLFLPVPFFRCFFFFCCCYHWCCCCSCCWWHKFPVLLCAALIWPQKLDALENGMIITNQF